MNAGWVVVGVDPAPSKDSIFWFDSGPETVPAGRVPDRVRELVGSEERLVLAWDAPLSFDPANGYSDRPVDREVRRFFRRHPLIGKGAVSVLPFASCPHWAIGCQALGLPFGPERSVALAPRDGLGDVKSGAFVIEVHPAVTLGFWWLEREKTRSMGRYKGSAGRPERKRILEVCRDLEIPAETVESDDLLDAWVAWRMGVDFLRGDASWLGDPFSGAYVMPSRAIGKSGGILIASMAR